MAQRSVQATQIDYVLLYGKVYDRNGAHWLVLRRKDVPVEDQGNPLIDKVIGLVICMEVGEVSTVYKRDRPSLYIRKKPKHDRRGNRREESGNTDRWSDAA